MTDIRRMPFQELRDRGFRGIVFDKDNTLTLPYARAIHAPLKPAIDAARKAFGDRLAVLSNSVGSSDDIGFVQAEQLERSLQLRVVRHGTKVSYSSLRGRLRLSKSARLSVPPSNALTETTWN